MKSYPKNGQVWVFDLGFAQVQHHYETEGKMTYHILTGPHRLGESETVDIVVEQVGASLYMVSWKEMDGVVVTHVEDYEKNVFYSSAVLPDKSVMRVRGTMTLLKDSEAKV